MAKPAITKRSVKGAALTYAELDNNFQNLSDATVAVTGDTGTITNDLNSSFQIAGGTGLTSSVSGTILTVNLDNTAVTAGSYTAANITVDAQGRITAAANGSASGSGTVNSGTASSLAYYPSTGTTVDDAGLKYYTASGVEGIQASSVNDTRLVSSGPAGYVAVAYGGDVIISTSTGNLISAYAANLAVGSVVSGSTANIRPTAHGAARTLSIFGRSGSADGASLSLDSAATITTVSNGNISLSPNGTGKVVIDGLSWPTADGTANQVLKTDGAGNLSWVTQSGSGLSNPLTADLNVGSYKLISSSNGNITLEPNGTGDIYLTSDTVVIGDLNTNAYVKSNGTTADLAFLTGAANSPFITLHYDGQVEIHSAGGSSEIELDNQNWPTVPSSLNYKVLTTSPNGAKADLSWQYPIQTFNTTQRDLLTSYNGMMIYNSTTAKFQGRAGGVWVDLH